jgi:hypothetical protein
VEQKLTDIQIKCVDAMKGYVDLLGNEEAKE